MRNLLLLLAFTAIVLGQEPKENVIYKYKQYEKFDLGDMSIKGDIITPGDISVKQRKFKVFSVDLYERTNFDDVIAQDIRDLR